MPDNARHMNRDGVLFVIFLSMMTLALTYTAAAEPDPYYTMRDLTPNVTGLLQSNVDDAYFVVDIVGTPDFIQLYGSRGEAFLDFPMFTPRQIELRARIEETCRELGLTHTVNRAPNGAEMLDYTLPAAASEIANILSVLLVQVYAADIDTALEFEANGFDLSAIKQ